MSESFKSLGAVFLFFALAAFYFGDVLSGKYLLNERDLDVFFIPPRMFWADEVKSFTFPLWNPYYYAGHPLFATLQPGVLYPFSVFYLFFPFPFVFNYTIVSHFALAGIFTYALMRGQKAGHGASVIAGLCFMLSGYLLSVHSLLSTLLSVTWVPLFLLVYFSAFRKNDATQAVWAGVAGTVMFLGGGVEVCYLTFSLTLVLSLFPGMVFEDSQYPSLKNRAGIFAVFILTFAGLSAVQLLPFRELSHLSIRADGLSYQEATTWSLHPGDLAGFFVHDLYGYADDPEKYWSNQNWLKSVYMGSAPFLLSLFFFVGRDRKAQGLLFLILVSFLLAFGKYSPFNRFLFDYIPFFNKLRYPVKFIFLAVLVLSLTAGLGYDRFKEGLKENREPTLERARAVFFIGFLSMLAFGFLNFFNQEILVFCRERGWDKPDYNDIEMNLFNLKRFLGFTGLFSLFLFLCAENAAKQKFFSSGMAVLLALDLFFSHYGFYQKIPTGEYMKNGGNLDFVLSDPSLFRIYVTPRTLRERKGVVLRAGSTVRDIVLEKISPGTGLVRRIFDAGGVEVMIHARFKKVYDLVSTAPAPDSTNVLNMMNVKYLVSIPPVKSPDFKLVHMSVPMNEEMEGKDTLKIYENLKALPRAFLVGACRVVHSDDAFKDILSSKEFQPDRLVLLEESPENFPCKEAPPVSEKPAGTVRIADYTSSSVELEAGTDARAFLFLSESYYPGWEAEVNGRPAKMYRANYVFRAVALEPGENRVRFQYKPLSFRVGAVVSVLSLAACIVFLARRRKT